MLCVLGEADISGGEYELCQTQFYVRVLKWTACRVADLTLFFFRSVFPVGVNAEVVYVGEKKIRIHVSG